MSTVAVRTPQPRLNLLWASIAFVFLNAIVPLVAMVLGVAAISHEDMPGNGSVGNPDIEADSP